MWNGGIYRSTDSGATWSQTSASTQKWTAIAMSASGTQMVAVVLGGGVYISTDTGSTWTLSTSAPTSQPWIRVVSSADGTELVAMASR